MNIILLGLIVINALISYKAINNTSFFRKYEFHIGSIKSGEQLRILSSGFLHVDFQHLFFNMFTLYFFAPYVIYNTSALYFLYIYMGSLIAGNLLTFYFHKNDYLKNIICILSPVFLIVIIFYFMLGYNL